MRPSAIKACGLAVNAEVNALRLSEHREELASGSCQAAES